MAKFDIPEPAKIAPNLTVEQRQAMQPIDLLAQYVMPRMLDKVNYLEWATKWEFHTIQESIKTLREYADNINRQTGNDTVLVHDHIAEISFRLGEVERRLAGLSSEKPKRTRSKKTKEKEAAPDSEPRSPGVTSDVSEPVAVTRVADYDPDKDIWVPKVIDGVEITASVVDMVASGVGSYSTEVAAFIYDLSDSERKVLCASFPDETMEESKEESNG